MVAPEHIGGYCPNCGTHHRVIESIPERPLRRTEIESLRDSTGIVACMPVMMKSGDMTGMDGDEDVTEDIVLATETESRLLSLYDGYGWVVDVEEAPRENEPPEDVAMEMYQTASNVATDMMTDAFREG